MMNHFRTPAEFSDSELALIRELLAQRYRTEIGGIEIHLADSELLLERDENPHQQAQPVTCPTVYWHARDANFVVFKCGDSRFRTQFFYTPHEQFGTGIEEYTRLDECVAAVLQTQSDHERARQGMGDNPRRESENSAKSQ